MIDDYKIINNYGVENIYGNGILFILYYEVKVLNYKILFYNYRKMCI